MSEITFEQMEKFLKGIGFVETHREHQQVGFLHEDSDTLVIIQNSDTGRIRELDLNSVIFRLDYNGLVNEQVLNQLRSGRLPLAS